MQLQWELWAELTEILMILSNMTSGGTWKSNTKYCREKGEQEASVFFNLPWKHYSHSSSKVATVIGQSIYWKEVEKKPQENQDAGLDYGDDTDDDCQQLLSLVPQRESD